MQAIIQRPPPAATLLTFLAGPVVGHDHVLTDLLLKAEAIEYATFIVFDYVNQAALHVADSMEGLCGYSGATAREAGASLVVKITNAPDLPYLLLMQAGYIQEAKTPGFSPRSVRFHDYYWSMVGKDGTKTPVVSTETMLTYTSQNDFGIGVGFHIRNDHDCDARVVKCKELLSQIKQRHNEVYPHPEVHEITSPYKLQHASSTAGLITQREKQVLSMLAQGQSTAAISQVLQIAANTVESHRKKLLQKFRAKNTAELIMKATKVFWLT